MDVLRGRAEKLAGLIGSKMPGLAEAALEDLRQDLDRLHLELSRRAGHASDWDDAIAWVRGRVEQLAAARGTSEEAAWCDAALRFGTHVQRRAFVGAPPNLLGEAHALLGKAVEWATERSWTERVWEGALERAWIAQAVSATMGDEPGRSLSRIATEAVRALPLPENGQASTGFQNRRLALLAVMEPLDRFASTIGVGSVDAGWARRVWERIDGSTLDPTIMAKVAGQLTFGLFRRGDEGQTKIRWREAIDFLDWVLARMSLAAPLVRARVEIRRAEAIAFAISPLDRLGKGMTSDERVAALSQARIRMEEAY